MKRHKVFGASVGQRSKKHLQFSCLLFWGLIACSLTWECKAQTYSFKDAQTRAQRIVSQMTLDEKIGQLHGFRDEKNFRIVLGVPRLGIPALRVTNGPAGVGPGSSGPQLRATALPAPIALAATWSQESAFEYGRLAGEETLALGSDLLEAPDINIVRVPQGGRTFESFSEDPWLNSRIAVEDIRGIQSAGVLANVKHYLANNQETDRGSINEIIGERTLREIYMPAFKAAVQEGNVDSLMCAYPRVNGAFNCENSPLLTDRLKVDWHFKGFVMSDFGAVHSTERSILAGLDLEMPTGEYFDSAMAAAIKDGKVPMARIDDALIRRYTMMIERGIFDRKPIERVPNPSIPVFAHGAVSRRLAEESIVLLKNESNLLPLNSRKLKSVALIGPYAVHTMTGGTGSSYVNPFYTIRPEDGIYSHMESQRTLLVLDGSDLDAAVKAAQKAEVAIVMIGDNEGEDHDHLLSLPESQNKLVSAVAAANPKTIVVLKSGSAVLMPWLSAVPAVLEAWYPGEEDGDAVANVLFGDAEPGGRLPITFPVRTEDTLARNPELYPGVNGAVHYSEGLLVGYRWFQSQKIQPLFPFGFGLSYTQFSYSDFSINQTEKGEEPQVNVNFRVTNMGTRKGSAVPQIYISFPPLPEGDEPAFQLKSFQKLHLDPGETRVVHLVLDRQAFSYWSEQSKGWKVVNGTFKVALATSSADLVETKSLTLR